MSDVGVLVTLDDENLNNRLILDYTSRDFASIRAQLIGLAKGLVPDWVTVGESADFGTVLLELFAYMGDTLNYYIDRTASEAFLSTAVRQQSVLYIADMLGYTPVGQNAASVKLTFTAYTPDPTDPLDPIVIPFGLKVHSSTQNADQMIVFETQAPLTLKPGEVGDVIALEGLTVPDYQIGTAFGVPNTEFILADKGIIFGSIALKSVEGYQNVVWNYTSDLSTARPTQAVFTTYTDDVGYTHVVFGDNTSGRIPAVGAKIYASYRYGVGSRANSLAADDLTTFIAPPGFAAWKITVTNANVPRGGTDIESIESMKYTVPRAGARIRNRAVTLNDYADLAMQVPGVVKSMAYGTVYTSVRVRIGPALGDGEDVPPETMAALCRSVEQYMADKVLIGSSVIAEPQDSSDLWQDIYMRITVHVAEVYNRTSVRQQVNTVLRRMLSYTKVDFGTPVTLGSVYRTILTVAGVEWAEVRWLSPLPPTIDMTAPVGVDTTTSTFVTENAIAPTQTLLSSVWGSQATGTGEPTAQMIRRDDDTSTAAVGYWELQISNQDRTPLSYGSNDRTDDLANLKVGDHVLIRTIGDQASWWDYVIHTAPVVHGGTGSPATPGFLQLKVLLARTSANLFTPASGQDLYVEMIRFSPSPVSAGNVSDITTPEVLIPRIEPTQVEEDATYWPDFTEEELKHDGLWVIATGGVANS